MPFGEALGAVNDGVEYANRYVTNKEVLKYAPPFYLSVARLLLAKRWTFLDGCTPTVGKEKDILAIASGP